MRDLHAFREQSGLRLKREADVKTAQRAECFSVSSAPSLPAAKKAHKGGVRIGYRLPGADT